MRSWLGAAVALFVAFPIGPQAQAQDTGTVIAAGVLRVEHPRPLPISRLDLPPEDLGFAGARLGLADNNTTGTFMGQEFTAEEVSVSADEAVAALEDLLAQGIRFVITMADAETTLALADAAGDRATIFNAMAQDDRLRGADCRANVLHTVPSRAMLTDALAQFLMTKRWGDWFLIQGSHEGDQRLGDAYRRSAAKFGARIVEERVFEDTGGARRTDAGHVQVQAQMPVFTQSAREHHVVITADETEVFANFMPFHTWDARPVAGSSGLRPVSWHPAQEAWGGTQLQTRFVRSAVREMRPEDYDAWVAIRALGEAAQRTNSTDYEALVEYIRSPELQLAVFKGVAANFRDWDGQLRQPIVLAADKVVVSVSPQDQFVHQFTPLDSLGTDRPETECRL